MAKRQMEEVDELVRLVEEAQGYLEGSNEASSVLERMVQRSELEKIVATLADDLRRIEREGGISDEPAHERLEREVIEPLAELSRALDEGRSVTPAGPSVVELQTVGDLMVTHIESGTYDLALDAYESVIGALDLIGDDRERIELADWLLQLATDAETLRDFAKIEMQISDFASADGSDPVVMIDGVRRTVGDEIGDQLIVHDVRANEVDFVFRGAVLTRES
ncbi:MAG: hypothetical protein AAF726_16955 [Planctomycetota bacterium]